MVVLPGGTFGPNLHNVPEGPKPDWIAIERQVAPHHTINFLTRSPPKQRPPHPSSYPLPLIVALQCTPQRGHSNLYHKIPHPSSP